MTRYSGRMPGDWLAVAANVTASPSTRRLWAIFMSFCHLKPRGGARGQPRPAAAARRWLWCGVWRRDGRRARGHRRCLRLDAELRFQLAPLALGPAIDAGDPGGGAGVDAAIERLVALSQLLPFQAGEAAAGLHRDQLLGDQLLHPFGLDAARQMNGAGRGGHAVVGGRINPQEAIGLALEGGNRNS